MPTAQPTQEARNANAPAPLGQDKKPQEPHSAWGKYMGDRVTPSAYEGDVYIWAKRGAWKNKPEQRVGVGMSPDNAETLIPLVLKAVEEARRQRAQKRQALRDGPAQVGA